MRNILINVIKNLDVDKIYYYSLIELKYIKIKLLLADLYGERELSNRIYNDLKQYVIKYLQICKVNGIYINDCTNDKKDTKLPNKPKAIVFGVGSYFEKSREIIMKDYDIIAFADNDTSKIGKYKDGVSIILPGKINTLEYDKILITSTYFSSICKQLTSYGINNKKIEVILNHGDTSQMTVSQEGEVFFNYKDIKIDLKDIYGWLLPQ